MSFQERSKTSCSFKKTIDTQALRRESQGDLATTGTTSTFSVWSNKAMGAEGPMQKILIGDFLGYLLFTNLQGRGVPPDLLQDGGDTIAP